MSNPYLTREEIAALGYAYRTTTAARMAKRGPFAPVTLAVDVLFESLPADGSPEVRWEGFGHVHGVERFGTHIMRRSPEGDGVEVMRSNDGTVVLRHPLGVGRTVRTFRHV